MANPRIEELPDEPENDTSKAKVEDAASDSSGSEVEGAGGEGGQSISLEWSHKAVFLQSCCTLVLYFLQHLSTKPKALRRFRRA